ncbi:MAG: hypothetical protein AB7V54_10020 [Parabacteroides sp.]|jgi:hypothetical protein|uniref:hypothetical protein n=1 Tax=Macellibacteroides TaxID=1159323 RepID=UPI002BCCC039|nr:hypothetical protein [Macellibacteroides fermentans]
MGKDIKIILDADVIIHFIKGECLSLLPQILPNYSYVLLKMVFDRELRDLHRTQIMQQITILKNITMVDWEPKGEALGEFLKLNKKFGLGESLSMVYCKYNNDVLASSNLKDIISYCEENKIVYFTTLDFIYQAFHTKIMTEKECDDFITKVLAKGSKLPVTCIADFHPRITL